MIEYLAFRAMNSDILLAAEGDKGRLARGFEETSVFIHQMEGRLTRFAKDSELAQLNRSDGSWFTASPELFEIIQLARQFHEETGGLFNPTVVGILENIGYDRSMDEMRARSIPLPASSIVSGPTDFQSIALEPAKRGVRLERGMRLDLGGIAKGWIAEQAAARLAHFASACVVNAGGDLFAIGCPAEGKWEVALEDPRDKDKTLAILHVGTGAVATSSITRRRWFQGTEERHHLIDARRGLPAITDWLSVTVVAPHAATAEVFAKALLIAGSADADSLSNRRPDIEFIAVDHSGQMLGSRHITEYLNDRHSA